MDGLNLVRATLEMYLTSAREASRALFKNWLFVPASLVAYLIFVVAANFVGNFGMAGGFVAGFFYIALLSFYYVWLRSIINKERLRLADIQRFDWSLFFSLISVGFLLWIVSLLTTPLASTEETAWVYACVQLALFILLNALPEVIYIRGYESIPALKYTANFIKENWVEWFLPLLLLFLPILLNSPLHLLTTVAGADPFSGGGDPLFPARLIFSRVVGYFSYSWGWFGVLLAVTLTNWFMLFRGFLFQKLDGSTRRRRIYQYRNN